MRRIWIVRSLMGTMFAMALSSGVVLATEPATGEVSSPASDWLIETIDATREVGYNVSVATDQVTGDMYVSYYEGNDGDLWLARTGAPVGNCGPGNTWECQVLDSIGIVGKYSSIAVGGSGPVASLYISYHDVTNGSLKVIEGAVDRETGALTYESFILDHGNPAVGFFAGTKTSVVVSESGTPHIGYQWNSVTTEYVSYATLVGPGTGDCGPGDDWECTVIHSGQGIGGYIDIDLLYDLHPVIAFFDGGAEDTRPIVASPGTGYEPCNPANQWQCEPVVHEGHDTGEYLALEITALSGRRLAYRNATTESLEWAEYVGAGGNCKYSLWQCEWIDGTGPAGSPSGIDMEIDDNGYPVIVYQDASSGDLDLKIARPLEALPWGPAGNCGPLSPTFFRTWFCETLDAGDINHAEAVGGLSIAMNANGEAAVAYRELFGIPPDEGRLKIAIEPISIFIDGFESGGTDRWTTTLP